MKLEQLVYVSVSRAQPTSERVSADILGESIRNNAPNNITGVLTWTGSRFVQILEGSSGSLDVLLLKLICDPRHEAMEVLDRRPVSARAFGRWAMIAPPPTPPFTESHGRRVEDLLQAGERSLDVWQPALLALVDAAMEVSAADPARSGL